MRVPVFLALVIAVAVVPANPARSTDEDDPCMSQWEGTSLNDNLYRLDFATKALKLLNGSENPKLRRLLEMDLVFAAATSRQATENKAVLASPYVAVNWLNSVRAAAVYATDQHLDSKPPTPRDASEANVLENLAVVET
jgi:hypothetical protein